MKVNDPKSVNSMEFDESDVRERVVVVITLILTSSIKILTFMLLNIKTTLLKELLFLLKPTRENGGMCCVKSARKRTKTFLNQPLCFSSFLESQYSNEMVRSRSFVKRCLLKKKKKTRKKKDAPTTGLNHGTHWYH